MKLVSADTLGRVRRVGLPLYFAVLVSSVSLLALPGFLGVSNSGAAWRLVLVPLWVAIVAGLMGRHGQMDGWLSSIRGEGRFGLAFLVVWGLGFLTALWASPQYSLPAAAGLIMIWMSVSVFAWVGITSWPERIGELLALAPVGLVVFVIANLALFMMGKGGLGGALRMLGAFGIHGQRVTFPMVFGANSFGSVAGAVLAWSGVWAWHVRRVHNWTLIGSILAVLLALLGVLLADSRGGILFGFASSLLVLGLPSRWTRHAAWAAVMPILAPVGLLIGDSVSGAFGLQSVWSKLNTLGSLSSRFATWRTAIRELLHPRWIHLIGFGYKGDVSSGVAQAAAQRVPNPRVLIVGPHNVILQYILDNGYLGAALFVLVMFMTIRRLAEMAATDRQNVVRPALGVMVYLALLGTIERVPTVYSPELFVVFLFIVIFTLFAPRAMDAKDSNLDGAGEDLAGRRRQEAV